MPAPAYMRLLPDKTLASLGRLELIARGVVEGFIAGKHRSPHKGFSVEFAEHRPYVPGDDLRNLDWRVLGRKDRYYIKQYVEETNLRATILVDASGSMAYGGDAAALVEGRRVTKFGYAQHLAACPGGETGLADIFHDIAERITRRGLVIVLSDLFDDTAALIQALHHFRYRRHEVLLFHIMAEEELRFPFDRFTHFKDLEHPGQELAIDPKTIRASYLERVRRFLDEVTAGCGRLQIDYVPVNTTTPFERALSEYLARRRA